MIRYDIYFVQEIYMPITFKTIWQDNLMFRVKEIPMYFRQISSQ